MQTTKTIRQVVTIKTCDVCGNEYIDSIKCAGCGIDVCNGCSWRCVIDPADDGEYFPPRACRQCRELSQSYRDQARILFDTYYDAVSAVEKNWVAECQRRKTIASSSPNTTPSN